MRKAKLRRDRHTHLLLKAGRGDGKAFGQLHAALHPAVQDFLASLNGSIDHQTREDIVQEVFLRAWNNPGRFGGHASAKTYLFGIAKNVLHQEMERRGKSPIVHLGNPDHFAGTYISDAPSSRARTNHTELSDAIEQARARLTKAQRQTIELDQILDLPRMEAARLARCSPRQFADRLYRAKKRLKQLLKDLPRCTLP